MTLAILCFLFTLVMLVAIKISNGDNPNGVSISIIQKLISILDYVLCRFRIISILLFSIRPDRSNPDKIEKIVWQRLCVVSVLFILFELYCKMNAILFNKPIRIIFCVYILLLQISMINSLIKPLFGVKRKSIGLEIDKERANKITVTIPTPKRSLLLALVNFFEIIISWGIIYRSLMPKIVDTADKANYFSIVTITTLGYGDINGGNDSLVQIAITFNMIIFVLFSICHITTILGTLTSKD